MIKTKDLVEFVESVQVVRYEKSEYKLEIVARLKELDKLRELLENRGNE